MTYKINVCWEIMNQLLSINGLCCHAGLKDYGSVMLTDVCSADVLCMEEGGDYTLV